MRWSNWLTSTFWQKNNSQQFHPVPMKTILFLCVGNSCRSQMAEGFARHYGKGKIEALSAGTEPGDKVAPKAVEVMAEKGIDISGQYPKLLTGEMVEKADICISMGCGVAESIESSGLAPGVELNVEESCPAILYKNFIDWGLEDPWGQGLEKYREIRDEIEEKVRELLDE